MPRYLLDTNLLRPALTPGSSLAERIRQNPADFAVSMVTVREALRGALAAIAEAESQAQGGSRSTLSARYALLAHLVEGLASLTLWPYSEEADRLYQAWPASVRRVGPNDCRIAASAILGGCTVLTRNVADFARIAEHGTRLSFLAELP